MKSITLTEHGGPEVLIARDADIPRVGPGDVLVRVEAAGVNFLDTYQRSGAYPLTLPFTLGSEGAGVIEAVGADVHDLYPGQRVGWLSHPGGYAEYAAVPRGRIVVLPDEVSTTIAAAVLLQGTTAHYLANSVYPVSSGTTTLVHAAAGGTGRLLVQTIVAKGGEVIATTSTPEKAERARNAGARHVFSYEDDIPSRVAEITHGQGVDVVYDGVGATTFEASLRSLRPRGVLAPFGASSGQVPPFDLQRLNSLGSLVITRPTLQHFLQTPEEFAWRTSEVLAAVADGSLDVTIAREYPLHEAGRAHEDLQSRALSGKLLIRPGA